MASSRRITSASVSPLHRYRPTLTPVTTTSRCPRATRPSASRRMSSGRRLRSCPREKGMMQKEHMKLQPSCTFKFARVSWYSPMPSIAKSSRLTVRVWRISGAGRRSSEVK